MIKLVRDFACLFIFFFFVFLFANHLMNDKNERIEITKSIFALFYANKTCCLMLCAFVFLSGRFEAGFVVFFCTFGYTFIQKNDCLRCDKTTFSRLGRKRLLPN